MVHQVCTSFDEQYGGTTQWSVRGQLSIPALSRAVDQPAIILSGAALELGYATLHSKLVLLYDSTIPHFIYFANPTSALSPCQSPTGLGQACDLPSSLLGSHRQRTVKVGCSLMSHTVGVGVGVKLSESQQPRPPTPDCSARPLLWPHQGLPQCCSGHYPMVAASATAAACWSNSSDLAHCTPAAQHSHQHPGDKDQVDLSGIRSWSHMPTPDTTLEKPAGSFWGLLWPRSPCLTMALMR